MSHVFRPDGEESDLQWTGAEKYTNRIAGRCPEEITADTES